jgi:hypothetical protein
LRQKSRLSYEIIEMVGGGRFIKEVVALYEKTLNPDELA